MQADTWLSPLSLRVQQACSRPVSPTLDERRPHPNPSPITTPNPSPHGDTAWSSSYHPSEALSLSSPLMIRVRSSSSRRQRRYCRQHLTPATVNSLYREIIYTVEEDNLDTYSQPPAIDGSSGACGTYSLSLIDKQGD
jgi:hypothetical protein